MFKRIRQSKWFPVILCAVLILLTLASRICVAYFLANDDPGDGKTYALLAKNLLEQKVFSTDTEAPFEPTFIRLPGYPLFIAAIYAIFGHGNDLAVRIVQAFIDTGTCILIAAIAWFWTEDKTRKRRAALWAFLIAVLSPFLVIYVATLLTETLTTFLLAAMTLTATLGLKAQTVKKSLLWWPLTGLIAGTAVFLRPDSGLFAAGIGLTLIIANLFLQPENAQSWARRLINVLWRGAVFSVAFILIFIPWTIRNYQVFHLFQPLAPAHGEMPNEFVPRGYNMWLRTWVDDERYVEPTLWNLGEKELKIEQLPTSAFDSDEERERVAALLESYNHPPGSDNQDAQNDSSNQDDDSDDNSSDSTDSDNKDDNQSDDANNDDQSSDDSSSDDSSDAKQNVKMTPEIDAAFGEIANQRISSDPFRYYVELPAKRAAGMWFATHSLYYPFGGEYSPTDDLDFEEHQDLWLPLFGGLTWIHTILAFLGLLTLWRARRQFASLRWLVLVLMMALLRILFFSSIENPEARYLVELFAFSAILGGIWLGSLKRKKAIEEAAASEIVSASETSSENEIVVEGGEKLTQEVL